MTTFSTDVMHDHRKIFQVVTCEYSFRVGDSGITNIAPYRDMNCELWFLIYMGELLYSRYRASGGVKVTYKRDQEEEDENKWHLVVREFEQWLRSQIKHQDREELEEVRDKLYVEISAEGLTLWD